MSSTTSATLSPITTSQQNDSRKLVDYLMDDLRTLSTEARKRHNHIKEAAESGLVKIRNISSSSGAPDKLLQCLRSSCTEVLHPFLLGCSSKAPRLVQISLQSIQRLLQFHAIDQSAVPSIVNELWLLTEVECEELKVLQTIAPFVSHDELLVKDWALAKCIVLTFRLNFSKDTSVINAASASIRQLFNCVFERVIQEDGIHGGAEMQIISFQQQRGSHQQQTFAPPTLRPAAADAFLLLRDLCTLIRREQPNWLIGVNKIAPILALELLESIVKGYPSIFFKHTEFADLLKTQICAQIIKMVVGEREQLPTLNTNTTNDQTVANNTTTTQISQIRPMPVSVTLLQQTGHSSVKTRDFPIIIRALRISLALITHYHSLLGAHNEVIIRFLLELLNHPSISWEAAAAIEVLHKILAQPSLLSWFGSLPDESKFIELIFSKLIIFMRKCLDEAAIDAPGSMRDENTTQPGFVYKGIFLPIDEIQLSAKRSRLLEWLDKHNAEKIPDAYCLSIGFIILIDITHSLYSVIESKNSPSNNRRLLAEEQNERDKDENQQFKSAEYSDQAKKLYQSTYGYLTAGLSTLLDISMDDTITEQILNCLSTMMMLACRIGSNEAKHVTLRTICRAALPTQYYVKFIESNTNNSQPTTIGLNATANETSVEPTQVVAMGTVCPCPYLPSQHFNTTVMLTAKNLQVARLLINCANANGQQLGDCWEMALTTVQHFVWIIGLRPTSSGSFRAGGDTNATSDGGPGIGSNMGNGVSTTCAGATNAGASSHVILTTAASSELPELNQQLNSLFESTTSLDDVSLHHVIAALCKLSNEAMMVAQISSRETSYFSIAKLLQTGLANLARLYIFWRPVSAHLLELCAHSNANTREWGAIALTQLIKNAIKQTIALLEGKQMNVDEITKREQLILSPLCAISEIYFLDVRAKQLDCLMRILQTESSPIEAPLWPMVLQIVTSIVSPEGRITDSQLIDQGFRVLSLVVKEFLTIVPFECVEMLIETDAYYGQQQHHLNVSLASIGQLWDISDFIRREITNNEETSAAVEHVWLVIYHALGRLCVDPRPPVRKSACDTLLQTVASHGQALSVHCWGKMLNEILFPMLNRVHKLVQTASTQRLSTASLGAPNLMIHHSRDTESKQWTETSVKTLSGVIKIFNAQRSVLLQLQEFPSCWSQLLRHIELAASADNAEMSLAALKNFQELLFGRPQHQTTDYESNRQSTGLRSEQQQVDFSTAPPLPEPLWLRSWMSWFYVARAIIAPDCPAVSVVPEFQTTANESVENDERNPSSFLPTTRKNYIPGLYHLTTLLEVLLCLFHRVRQQVSIDDFRTHRIGQIFQEIAAIPVPQEQLLFSIVNNQQQQLSAGASINQQHNQLNIAQNCLLNCIRVIIQEQIEPNSVVACVRSATNGSASNRHNTTTAPSLRAALPDMLRLLLSFVSYAWQCPVNKFAALQQEEKKSIKIDTNDSNNDRNTDDKKQNIITKGNTTTVTVTQRQEQPTQNLINFGEICLKMLLDFYTRTAAFEEVLQQTILIDIVKKLAEPLALKYRCPEQTTWQLAAATLNKVCQIGFPIARKNVNQFKQLWPIFANAVEDFLFPSSKSQYPLNADERKRHEFIDCLVIELIRTELLPFAGHLPREFMQRIIDILNRGSINTMDANDMLASDLHLQRTDLSRVCFDALLSLSQAENPLPSSAATAAESKNYQPMAGMLRNTSQSSATCSSLGATAISSLLNHCKQVLNSYARDEQNSGHFRLPQERIFEVISALRAVTALIEGFANSPNEMLYSHLVTLHPSLVQLIPCSRGDQQVELALMTCLNSYQTLLLLNLHSNK